MKYWVHLVAGFGLFLSHEANRILKDAFLVEIHCFMVRW